MRYKILLISAVAAIFVLFTQTSFAQKDESSIKEHSGIRYENRSYFPIFTPEPDIKEIRESKSRRIQYYYYKWNHIDEGERNILIEWIKERKGVLLNGWTHPGKQPVVVQLSEEPGQQNKKESISFEVRAAIRSKKLLQFTRSPKF